MMANRGKLCCGHCGHSNDGRGHGYDNAGNRYQTKTAAEGGQCPYCRFGILQRRG